MTHNDSLIRAAISAERGGRLDEAASICRTVLTDTPSNLDAQIMLGVIAARRSDVPGAIQEFKQCLEIDARCFEALRWLTSLYLQSNNAAEGIAVGFRALELRPKDAEISSTLGALLINAQRFDDAEVVLTSAVSSQPGVAIHHIRLGVLRQKASDHGGAAEAFQRALKIQPGQVSIQNALAHSLIATESFHEAASVATSALERNPNVAWSHLLAGMALGELGRQVESRDHLRRAVALDPNNAQGFSALGLAEQASGDTESAVQALRRSIELEPRQGTSYYALVQAETFSDPTSPLLAKMLQVAEDATLADNERYQLNLAIGKALEDLHDYERGMARYDHANKILTRLTRVPDQFDMETFNGAVDQTIKVFSSEFIEQNRHLGSESELPVLVIGMIRSGTTLTEQILSSHPDVAGAGEQMFWSVEADSRLDSDRVRDAARRYCELLQSYGPSQERVTDKMPGNFMLVGSIHAHLPRARFIHVRRNPIDTCLSIWTTRIPKPPPYQRTKMHIVSAYRGYLRMMEHWRRVIPSDRLLEIDYEMLVSDRESVTRTMLEFCGLSWSEACLHPEENRRTVTTPSLFRVRRPIDKARVERWRRFEPWLGDFRDLQDGESPTR